MTSSYRSRCVTVAAVFTATAGLALWPAPQSFAALPPDVVAFDPQPDPPGRLLQVESVDKDARGYGVPDTFEGAIIIHYSEPALGGKR